MEFFISFAFSIFLFVSFALADLDPNQFVIGAWGGPVLAGSARLDSNGNYIINPGDTTAFRGIQDDHFNAINVNVTLGRDMFHIFEGRAGEPSMNVDRVAVGDISNRYRLACLSYFNLKTMVWDKILGDSPNLYWSKSDFKGKPVIVCGERGWYVKSFFAGNILHNQLSRYEGLNKNQLDKILGYFLGDEPNTNSQTTATLLNNMDSVFKYEPERPALINLLPMNHFCPDTGGSGFSSESEYQSYVRAYANHSSVKILCFDIYPIVNNAVPPTSQRFWNTYGNNPLNGSRVYFFRNYDVFIALKKPGQKFWAVIQGGRPDQHYNNFTPNEKSARFCLNSALIYGAQGIWWYAWHSPQSQYNICDKPIRGAIAMLNRELQTMSPELMRLTWINTVHGKATDPQSGETSLKTLDQETQVLKMGPSETFKNIAIGVFKNGAERYLMVFNKNLTDTAQNKTIVLNAASYTPTSFNKITGSWENILFKQNIPGKATSFTVDLLPAEMKLIKLN
jgi:hypothetical protein